MSITYDPRAHRRQELAGMRRLAMRSNALPTPDNLAIWLSAALVFLLLI